MTTEKFRKEEFIELIKSLPEGAIISCWRRGNTSLEEDEYINYDEFHMKGFKSEKVKELKMKE